MAPVDELPDDRATWRNGLLLVLLFWLLTSVLFSQRTVGLGNGDLSSALAATRLLKAHQSEYARGYVDPPLLAVALRPLIKLPVDQINYLWSVTCVACLLGAVALFAKACDFSLRDAATLGVLLIVAFHYRPTVLDFRQQQFMTPMLALLCAAYVADSHGHYYRLATCIALAALVKLWLLGLMIYLLFRRRTFPFLWGVGLFAGCMAGLLARVGWREGRAYWNAMRNFLATDVASDFRNQSILGFVRVHFGPNHAAVPFVDNPMVLIAVATAGMLIVICGLAIAFRVEQSKKADQRRLCLGLTISSLLLVMPICQQHNYVLFLPPLWTLLTASGVPVLARFAGVVAYVLMTFSFEPADQLLSGIATLTPSSFFFGAVLIWLALLAAVTKRQEKVVYSFDPIWE